VVIEQGSELAAELWGTRHRASSSILSYPEGRAALAAAHRAGRLTGSAHNRAREDFDTVLAELLLVGIDEPLARHAGDLAERLQLRGYDAVHLASALAMGVDTTVLTWDRDLSRAAALSGCAVAPAAP
jgi:predicted nucleic acid-binding protein